MLFTCSVLLLDCLDTSQCIFITFESLHSNKTTLLRAWLAGHWEWLIVFCDSAALQSGNSERAVKIIKRDPSSKRAIILTACSVQRIMILFE